MILFVGLTGYTVHQERACVYTGESTVASSAAECAVHCDILDTECTSFVHLDKVCYFLLKDEWCVLVHRANTTAYIKKTGTCSICHGLAWNECQC